MSTSVSTPMLDKAQSGILNSREIADALRELEKIDPDRRDFGVRLRIFDGDQDEASILAGRRGPGQQFRTIEAALVAEYNNLLEIIAKIEASRIPLQVSEISDRICRLLALHLGVAQGRVVDGASLSDDLGADSLDEIEMVMTFEEEFGCEIPYEISDDFRTVGDIVRYITEMASA